jgi:SH3 domain protein
VRRLPLLLICLCILAVAQAQAQAETRYITDQCSIPLRKGQSTRYKIARMLPSGSKLEIITSSGNTGYTQVRTEDGIIGYVASTELQDEPAARDHLATMEAKLAELQQAPDALAAKLSALQAQYKDLAATHERVSADRDRLEQELATLRSASANIVEVTNDRAELRKRVAELTRQAAELEQQNRDLALQTNQRWFMIGAAVIGGGILIGLILPNLRFRRRKSSWGSL